MKIHPIFNEILKQYHSAYDYVCKSCSHEFDYDEGLMSYASVKWIECPVCGESIEE